MRKADYPKAVEQLHQALSDSRGEMCEARVALGYALIALGNGRRALDVLRQIDPTDRTAVAKHGRYLANRLKVIGTRMKW